MNVRENEKVSDLIAGEKIATVLSKTMTVSSDGFHAALFTPSKDIYPDKALILFGGTDGNFKNTCKLSRLFCSEGITVMALAYFNVPGLTDMVADIPAENIQRAAEWLRKNGRNKVALWGISMGGEYALLAGSLLPELISCVIAVSPMDVVTQGCSSKGRPRTIDTSAFSWQGKTLPYMAIPEWTFGRVVRESLKAHESTMNFAYSTARPSAPENSIIPVERIGGPVLLISAKYDSIWPGAEAGERVIARLDACGFAYAHKHLCYEFGSHLMYPIKSRLFRIERKHPQESFRDKQDSFCQTMEFLKNW